MGPAEGLTTGRVRCEDVRMRGSFFSYTSRGLRRWAAGKTSPTAGPSPPDVIDRALGICTAALTGLLVSPSGRVSPAVVESGRGSERLQYERAGDAGVVDLKLCKSHHLGREPLGPTIDALAVSVVHADRFRGSDSRFD